MKIETVINLTVNAETSQKMHGVCPYRVTGFISFNHSQGFNFLLSLSKSP